MLCPDLILDFGTPVNPEWLLSLENTVEYNFLTFSHCFPSGCIREGDDSMLGPYDDGQFQSVTVKTVHRHRLPCRLIQAGQASSVALVNVEREDLRKVRLLYIWLYFKMV